MQNTLWGKKKCVKSPSISVFEVLIPCVHWLYAHESLWVVKTPKYSPYKFNKEIERGEWGSKGGKRMKKRSNLFEDLASPASFPSLFD